MIDGIMIKIEVISNMSSLLSILIYVDIMLYICRRGAILVKVKGHVFSRQRFVHDTLIYLSHVPYTFPPVRAQPPNKNTLMSIIVYLLYSVRTKPMPPCTSKKTSIDNMQG